MNWKRARNEEQKRIRILSIINATERLFCKYSYEEINLTLISKEADFTRSNIYKYFSSKEEIFIEILKKDISNFTEEMLITFQEKRKYTIEEFVDIFINFRLKYNRIRVINSILNSTIERNCSIEKTTELTKFLNDSYETKCKIMCQLFKEMTMEKAYKFLILEASVSTGLHSLSNINIPDMKLVLDYREYYKSAVLLILKGLLK